MIKNTFIKNNKNFYELLKQKKNNIIDTLDKNSILDKLKKKYYEIGEKSIQYGWYYR